MSLAPQQKNTWVLFAAETVVTKVVFSFSRTFSQGKQIFLQLCTCTLCMFICETASESTDEPVTSIDISRRVKHPRRGTRILAAKKQGLQKPTKNLK